MFNRLLIANRGEIACRIIRTAQRLGIHCISVYSTADHESLHVAMADSAYCIGAPEAQASYLNIDNIIRVAKEARAEAIHPGYGFLSENLDFVRACTEADIIFVGPSLSAMTAMASKQLAKQLLSHTDVPLTPGYHGNDQADDVLLQEAVKIGFPVLLKAANGGGGKGMRDVKTAKAFQAALEGARREALACFGDDIMIIEKLIQNPRHIEIQLMADHFGTVVHLFDRDCSIQRRHQKIIEEAPAPNLSDALREKLAYAAITVASAIEYRGAGTVEFLVDDQEQFYFMEMNTRLQVEHPVTEAVTGLDLVEWQLRIAAKKPIPCTQDEIQIKGHAIECRIYAEDPYHQFMPSTGIVHFLEEPKGEGIRMDSSIVQNSRVTMYYDPMIAKLIAFGLTRDEAIRRMEKAIRHYHIGGVKTNLPLLQGIIAHSAFKETRLSTHFLTQYPIDLPMPSVASGLLIAASFDYLNLPVAKTALEVETFAWQMHLPSHWSWEYVNQGEQHTLTITPIDLHQFTAQYLGHVYTLTVRKTNNPHQITVDDGEQRRQAIVDARADAITIYTEGLSICFERFTWLRKNQVIHAGHHSLASPMPATVVAILKKTGDLIQAGEAIMVLEAMKMEHSILSPKDGVVAQIFYQIGDQVHEGAELLELGESPS